MIHKIMKYTRNFFPGVHHEGSVTVEQGGISLSLNSRYALIEGSKFNDGVHKVPLTGLTDETFVGCITELNPPEDFIELVEKIEQYETKNEKPSFDAESFGGYSRSGYLGWKDYFKEDLKVWCKI